jgi:hypothetical protein
VEPRVGLDVSDKMKIFYHCWLDNSDEKGMKICMGWRIVSVTVVLLKTFQFARLMLILEFVKVKVKQTRGIS